MLLSFRYQKTIYRNLSHHFPFSHTSRDCGYAKRNKGLILLINHAIFFSKVSKNDLGTHHSISSIAYKHLGLIPYFEVSIQTTDEFFDEKYRYLLRIEKKISIPSCIEI